MKDRLFRDQKGDAPFVFSKAVADVFDDMASRSIPLYEPIQSEIASIIAARTKNRVGAILDLGCSTGYTLELLRSLTQKPLIGVDLSSDMIERSKERLQGYSDITLHTADIREFQFPKISAVIFHYILQFLPIPDRLPVLKKAFSAIESGGIAIVSEKVANSSLNDLYWDMKRRHGYTEEEISNKHKALEGVLVPLTAENNLSLLKDAGFKNVQEIFRGYQFVTFIGER